MGICVGRFRGFRFVAQIDDHICSAQFHGVRETEMAFRFRRVVKAEGRGAQGAGVKLHHLTQGRRFDAQKNVQRHLCLRRADQGHDRA